MPSGAVILDCDGTLVDTEELSRQAFTAVLTQMGHRFDDDDYANVVGHAAPHTRRYLTEVVGVRDLTAFQEALTVRFAGRFAAEVRVYPDVRATIDRVREAGLGLGLCTSSHRPHVARVMALPEMAGVTFDAVVTAEDTTEHKPGPAPYLRCAALLGVPPEACVVVEDSPTGATAALAAGMRTIVVDRGLHDLHRFDGMDVELVGELSWTALQPG